MNDKKIGIQIKKARLEAQQTQTQLGNKIGVTWEMISRYENGKSSPRKNLEKIAEVLGKPIQYFFGVEEMPIRDELTRLAELLEKKGNQLQTGVDIPLIETLEGFTITKALSFTNQSYSCPSWIHTRFTKIFALRLDDVASDVVSVGKGDVGFFSQSAKAKADDFVLVKESGSYIIIRYSKGLTKKVHAVLLAVEKRYYE